MWKSLSSGAAFGRRASNTCTFFSFIAFRDRRAGGKRPISGLRETLEVVIGVAELLRDHGEAAEAVAHFQFLGHAHGAIDTKLAIKPGKGRLAAGDRPDWVTFDAARTE